MDIRPSVLHYLGVGRQIFGCFFSGPTAMKHLLSNVIPQLSADIRFAPSPGNKGGAHLSLSKEIAHDTSF
jgi:hypothetical protein